MQRASQGALHLAHFPVGFMFMRGRQRDRIRDMLGHAKYMRLKAGVMGDGDSHEPS